MGCGFRKYRHIAVPVGIVDKLPKEFELKTQTGKVKRYWTTEIARLVLLLIDARETVDQIRQEMVRRMHSDFDRDYAFWQSAVEAAANLDCLISLSHTTVENGEGPVCRPVFLPASAPDAELRLLESRHPCLSGGAALRGSTFIHNDIVLGCSRGGEGQLNQQAEPRACVVTGPNMGGKSTLLRQACVSVILAQVGAFVPASECRLRTVDRIFTRIGASDRIMQGQSTFLVELAETATILKHATRKSLVVLDELGRGTSTHDGYAIAGAVLNHLVTSVRPLLLFSTHYHALTDEVSTQQDVSLYHMDCLVDEPKRLVTFLYKFVRGVSSESYGLHCAQAAGLPSRVVARAAQHKESMKLTGGGQALRQVALFKALMAHLVTSSQTAAEEGGEAGLAELLRLQREVVTLVKAMAASRG
ncbi:muts domain V-domain-containing protein [Baffinella frigidus]|nr:muts domain V-domain-containing protein [Cryptophyta sp. CCMP2293]